MKICTNCGAENPDFEEFCAGCRVPLPEATTGGGGYEEPEEEAKDEMSRYNDIKKAVEKIKHGEWNMSRFEAFLQELMAMLSRFEQEIRDVNIPEESYDDFSMELDIGFNGVDLYNEGLANLMLYVTDQNNSYLETGLDLIHKGNSKINEAIRVNRSHRKGMGEVQGD